MIHHLDIRSLKIPVPEKDDAIFSECYSYFGKDIFFFSHNCGATMTDEKIPIEDLQKILDFIISNK